MKVGGDWIELTLLNREIQFQSNCLLFRTEEISKKFQNKMAQGMTGGRTCRKWAPHSAASAMMLSQLRPERCLLSSN